MNKELRRLYIRMLTFENFWKPGQHPQWKTGKFYCINLVCRDKCIDRVYLTRVDD